ncbi:MAG: hypothetical protein AABW54_03510 [Candidatus Micrarchaeota archaeon]
MTEKIGLVIACLKELGVKPRLASFEDRLVIQKVVFLLKKLGVDAGFGYGLYVRGPYSPDLTKSLYTHQTELEGLQASCRLSKREADVVNKLRELAGKPKLLEIASTYLYLTCDLHAGEDDATRRLKELKPFFSEADVAVGVSKAKQLVFKPTAEDLAWLKKETAVWNAVSNESLARFDAEISKAG